MDDLTQKANKNLSLWKHNRVVLDRTAMWHGLKLECKCYVGEFMDNILKLRLGEDGELGSLSVSTDKDTQGNDESVTIGRNGDQFILFERK